MRKEDVIREVISWAKVFAIAFSAAFIIDHVLIVNADVPTGSMESTVMTGSRIIINRLAYLTEDPDRGDIISFKFPDNPKENYLKRIIGLPGETVEGRNGNVYVDGDKLSESYIQENIRQDFGPYTVPSGCYFMMGDNRNNSWDSRFWSNTFVKKDAIIGKAEFEYYPQLKSLD